MIMDGVMTWHDDDEMKFFLGAVGGACVGG